jgi:hypothetical protein
LTVIDTLFPASKVYDKTKVITITSSGTLSGVIEGDDLSLISVSASYYDSYNVGNDKTVFIRYEIEGADKNNYNLESDTSRTASITPALLTATVGDYRQIYGESPPAFEVEVTGFVGNDSILNIINPTASAGTDSSSAVGTYTIEITGGSAINDNYIFDVRDTGSLTIEKVAGPAAPSEQIVGQFPSEATSIELTGFASSASGLEAAVAIDGTNYAAYADMSVDESGGATIAGLSGVTTATKVRIRVKETATSSAGSYKEISVKEKVFVVGSIGPGGGYVFYDDEAGYDFDSSGTIEEDEKNLLPDARYLEAAPYGWYDGDTDSQGEYSGDDDPRFQWGVYGYAVDPPATATAIGSGATNTANIVDFHDNLSDYYTNRTTYDKYNDGTVAAKVCAEYSLEDGGVTYDNWFLPSKDELNLMYRNLKDQGLGSFTVYNHWSSSEYDENKAWYQFFENGNQDGYVRNYSLRVRPVRAF